jgi:hypothetical protein
MKLHWTIAFVGEVMLHVAVSYPYLQTTPGTLCMCEVILPEAM